MSEHTPPPDNWARTRHLDALPFTHSKTTLELHNIEVSCPDHPKIKLEPHARYISELFDTIECRTAALCPECKHLISGHFRLSDRAWQVKSDDGSWITYDNRKKGKSWWRLLLGL